MISRQLCSEIFDHKPDSINNGFNKSDHCILVSSSKSDEMSKEGMKSHESCKVSPSKDIAISW